MNPRLSSMRRWGLAGPGRLSAEKRQGEDSRLCRNMDTWCKFLTLLRISQVSLRGSRNSAPGTTLGPKVIDVNQTSSKDGEHGKTRSKVGDGPMRMRNRKPNGR